MTPISELKVLLLDARMKMRLARTTDDVVEAIAAINKFKLVLECERGINTNICEVADCWEEGTLERPDGAYVCSQHYTMQGAQ